LSLFYPKKDKGETMTTEPRKGKGDKMKKIKGATTKLERVVQKTINQYAEDYSESGAIGLFGDKWDKSDPFADDTNNQNLLAWFGFEETARRLADKNGIEI